MPVGEEVMIDDTPTYVHHTDDQDSWENDPILHPQFIPGQTPKEGELSDIAYSCPTIMV